MTLNRMGRTRGKGNRKLWLTGTLTLGAVATSGGVAMAALHEEPEHSSKVAAASHSLKVTGSDTAEHKSESEKAKAQVCLRLDKKAQAAIADAAAAAKGATISVPLSKVEVRPCPANPAKPGPTAPPASPAPAPVVPPAPVKTTAPVPVKPSTPAVTTTAS
jgi:hypothetical protein